MNRIAVDRYIGPVWYDSFAEVVADFTSGEHVRKNVFTGEDYNELDVFIDDVVLFNVCYRDYLRARGIDVLIELLFKQAPAFRSEAAAIKALRERVEKWGQLADYDIQCLSTDDSFTILGHRFDGLDDVRRSVEKYHRQERYDFDAKKFDKLDGIHVLCDYEPYPIFDSSDFGDDREYRNYFFLQRPFIGEDIVHIDKMPTYGNNSKVSEHLDYISEMPLLYYKGDGPSMLLVTAK